MNTSRVPGVTRNSGWEAVTSEIDRARALRQQPSETPSTAAEAQAGERHPCDPGDGGRFEQQGCA